jgi:hypothetical protein
MNKVYICCLHTLHMHVMREGRSIKCICGQYWGSYISDDGLIYWKEER